MTKKNDILSTLTPNRTPQSEPANSRQIKNSHGGYVFAIGRRARVRRFMILGVENGSYYANARELAKENATTVIEMANDDGMTLIDEIIDISVAGRAPRQNAILFTLAAATASENLETRQAAWTRAFPQVVRTGTQLKMFLNYRKQFAGIGGRASQRAIGAWLTDRDVNAIAYQMVKYRNREGWENADVLAMIRPTPKTEQQNRLFRWAMGYDPNFDGEGIRIVEGFQKARKAHPKDVPGIVREYGLSWEMVPTTSHNDPLVWEAILENGMPMTAMIRQLPRLTNLGVIAQTGSQWTQKIVDQITNSVRLKTARVHPMTLLLAHSAYASGKSQKGNSTWKPIPRIVDALDAGFYAAFGAVQSTGKTHLLALDVSGSMGWSYIANTFLSAREASAAMALVTANVEPEHRFVGFTGVGMSSNYYYGNASKYEGGLTELSISPRQRLTDAVRTVSNLPMGPTDCALPILWAQSEGLRFDTISIYTDNESWQGNIHVHQAATEYRKTINPGMRLVAVGMTATEYSVLDPSDPGSMNVVGFDSSAPQLISDFSTGKI